MTKGRNWEAPASARRSPPAPALVLQSHTPKPGQLDPSAEGLGAEARGANPSSASYWPCDLRQVMCPVVCSIGRRYRRWAGAERNWHRTRSARPMALGVAPVISRHLSFLAPVHFHAWIPPLRRRAASSPFHHRPYGNPHRGRKPISVVHLILTSLVSMAHQVQRRACSPVPFSLPRSRNTPSPHSGRERVCRPRSGKLITAALRQDGPRLGRGSQRQLELSAPLAPVKTARQIPNGPLGSRSWDAQTSARAHAHAGLGETPAPALLRPGLRPEVHKALDPGHHHSCPTDTPTQILRGCHGPLGPL